MNESTNESTNDSTSGFGSNNIGGYDDIHDNLRYWIARIAAPRGSASLVFYDIGANDGELSLPFARPPHRVVAFEPAPAARRRLVERVTQQGDPAVLTVVPVALGAGAGRAILHVYSDDTFSSLHGRPREDLDQYNLQPSEEVEVPVVALDAVVPDRQLPAPDIVKIDVEGAELDVLRGATATLRRWEPLVVMEYSCINTRNAGYPREELLRELARAGYDRIYGLYRNTDRTLYTGAALESCRIWNVLAVPERFAAALDASDLSPEISP